MSRVSVIGDEEIKNATASARQGGPGSAGNSPRRVPLNGTWLPATAGAVAERNTATHARSVRIMTLVSLRGVFITAFSFY